MTAQLSLWVSVYLEPTKLQYANYEMSNYSHVANLQSDSVTLKYNQADSNIFL